MGLIHTNEVHSVVYMQKISEGEQSVVTNQGSVEGTTIRFSGDPGACPQENFIKLHLKICIFVHSESKF